MKRNFEMFEVDTWIEPNEEKIVDTVNKSIEIFYLKEQEKLLTYREFLWSQFPYNTEKMVDITDVIIGRNWNSPLF